jgi:hypothetical protein
LDESQNSDGRREWSKQNTDQCDCHVVTSIWWRIETIARKWRTTPYYNHEHRHSGIALHTPASVHYGTSTEISAQRAATLDAAYAANPDRFRGRRPAPPKLPTVAWINDPSREALIQNN